MKNTYALLLIAIVLTALSAKAQETPAPGATEPERIITFGLRAGINSSSLSTNYIKAQPELIRNEFYWRTGGQIGAVADVRLCSFLAIEVGAFWQNRSFDCALMTANTTDDYMGSMFLQNRFNTVSIPVMLSFRFNFLPQVMFQFDAGGYYAYGFAGKKEMDSYIAFDENEGQLVFDHTLSEGNYFGADAKEFLAVNRADLGIKTGIGLTFLRKYFLGVYFERSLKNNAKNRPGSPEYKIYYNNWSVSLGYNF